MKKYDCSKILDYEHEQQRLCKSKENCYELDGDGCPLRGQYCNTLPKITQVEIDILQKWSDEHPEQKLSKKDRAFLESFNYPECKMIHKDSMGTVFFHNNGYGCVLSEDMFKDLEPADTGTPFEELLKWEVEE